MFLLPPGWARFPAAAGREHELNEAIEAVVSRAIPQDLPRDSAEPYRHLLRDKLRQSIADATGADASVVYLPVAPVEGMMVPASVIETEFLGEPGADALDTIPTGHRDAHDDYELLEMDGRPAVRLATTQHEIEYEDGPPLSSRQVFYAISRDEEGHWLGLSFNVIWNSAQSERYADALVMLFDAIMTTFRWAGEGGARQPWADVTSVPGSSRLG